MTSRALLKPDEAAAFLAVSPRTLWELTHRRGLPCVRIGRCLRYRESDLVAWVDKRREAAAPGRIREEREARTCRLPQTTRRD